MGNHAERSNHPPTNRIKKPLYPHALSADQRQNPKPSRPGPLVEMESAAGIVCVIVLLPVLCTVFVADK